MSEDLTPETTTEQPLADRGSNRSQRPSSAEFVRFITSGWGERPSSTLRRSPAADHTAARRSALSAQFPGERLVIPAGTFKPRSNDTDYRFRPHSAFAHLTGLGSEQEPDAVLVLHPVEDGTGDDGSGHRAVLYIRPLAGRDTEEFFSDARYGEFWVGARPTLEDLETLTGVRTAHVDDLRDALAKDVGARRRAAAGGAATRTQAIEELVEEIRATEAAGRAGREAGRGALRAAAGQGRARDRADAPRGGHDDRRVREDRPRAPRRGRAPPRRAGHRGHVRSATPGRRATRSATRRSPRRRARHARCTGPTTTARCAPGELVLVDAGVEVDSLYTADVTRTLPVDGTLHRGPAPGLPGRPRRGRRRLRRAPCRASGSGTCTRPPCRSSPRVSRSGGCCPCTAQEALAAGEPAPPPVDGARHQPPPRPRRARLRAGPRASSTSTGSSSPAWCSPSSPACTSSPTTCWSRRSTAASACGSRTTCWSPRTGTRTCPPRCRATPDADRGVDGGSARPLRCRSGPPVGVTSCEGTSRHRRQTGPNLALLFSKRDDPGRAGAGRRPQVEPDHGRERLRAGRRRREARAGLRAVGGGAGGAGGPTGGTVGDPHGWEPAAGGYAPDGSDGLVVVIGAGGRAGQPDWTPPISRRSSRALCACSCRHRTA